MRTFLLRHARNTVYSNVWIAFGAALWVHAAGIEIGAKQSVAAWLTFFATVFVYNFQRVVKLSRRTKHVIPGRNAWLYNNRFWIWVWVIVGGIGSGFTALFLPPAGWRTLAVPALISLLYVVQFIPAQNGLRTLRELPGAKILLIAACWAVVGSFLPLVFDRNPDARVWWMWGEKCAFILAITIPFDIRDLKYDDAHMRTLPQLLGLGGAKTSALVLVVISAGLTLGALLSGWYTPPYAVATWVALVPAAWLIAGTHEDRPELYFTAGLDGTIALMGGLQLLALFLFG